MTAKQKEYQVRLDGLAAAMLERSCGSDRCVYGELFYYQYGVFCQVIIGGSEADLAAMEFWFARVERYLKPVGLRAETCTRQ